MISDIVQHIGKMFVSNHFKVHSALNLTIIHCTVTIYDTVLAPNDLVINAINLYQNLLFFLYINTVVLMLEVIRRKDYRSIL
jgi:hypothetical protein